MSSASFADRTDAGIKLAKALSHYKNYDDLLIFGLPRGGIPVAFEVAKFLKAPLDALLVKKLGVPGQEELAFGAIAMGGVSFLNDELISVSSCITLSNSLLVTGFPYIHDERWDKGFDIFKTFYSKTRGIRRLGAAALDFCFVAMGRFEGFWEFSLQSWDICAGAIILQEAGGKATDWDGSPLPFSGERILATNGKINQEMQEILNRSMELFK